MQDWFRQAKLGIFIHWGIYAVKGISESWSFYHGQISYEDYMAQCEGFTASNYDPEAWADLFRRAGARYAVLTTKHHDGVALWDTRHSDLSVVKKTPAGRDLIRPYTDALRKQGLKVGFYFSHLDWSHPDYASVYSSAERERLNDLKRNPFTHPAGAEDHAAWERFLQFHRAQLEELLTNFGHLDILWFDGDWERDAEQWRFAELRAWLDEHYPKTIINSRMGGYGDYATPEQGIPVVPPKGPWEYCVTMNNSWGYQPHDKKYKSPEMLIWIFCETIGLGGNLLLDIGPMEDGTIPPEQVERLERLGEFIKGNEEAVYPTQAGLPRGHYYGPSTLSQDGSVIYLFQFGIPQGPIPVKGIHNQVKNVSVLKSGERLQYDKLGGAGWLNIPGILWIDLPEKLCDAPATVIKVELEGALNLYREEGSTITDNV
ncbi:MAG: alpha-L-fucosidase [Limnochordia bacterium]